MPHRKDGKLISPEELNRMASSGGFKSLSHAVYRTDHLARHLTLCPRRRASAFEGRAAEVQRVLRAVAEAEGMCVIAVAAEPDHIHLLITGMTPKTCWSDWIGRWKALTRRQLKALPGLETFCWQHGYALAVCAGSKESSSDYLKAVENCILDQGDQADEAGDDGP